MLGTGGPFTDAEVAVLLVGLGIGAIADWRAREVTDHLWQAMATLGVALGAIALAPEGLRTVALWLVVGALALEQLFPWDLALEPVNERLPDLLELGAFLAVGLLLAAAAFGAGVGPGGIPTAVAAGFAGIVLARVLFELRVLYGGADAKALIATAVIVPVLTVAVLPLPGTAGTILALYPFPLTLLMDAALMALAAPIALAVRNARRGEFRGLRGFTTYSIPVSELPDHFAWLKEPAPTDAEAEEEPETTEEDRALRERQRDRLLAEHVDRAWVSPQIPFLVLLFAGGILAVIAGNLIFDLVALL